MVAFMKLAQEKWYWFDVCTSESGSLVLGCWQEQRKFRNRDEAYQYFLALSKATPRGFGYLSRWGGGEFPPDRVFGCKTAHPRKVIGA